MPQRYFTSELFAFLKELKNNNRREWFNLHKERYEELIKTPAQRFISDAGPHLAKVSPHFLADPRPVGGSLFRIYRDTRFGRDKSPYKTHVGIQFRHRAYKDAHAPGFYLHLEPRNCFLAAGTWQPDAETLFRIRQAIAGEPPKWKKVRDDRRLRAGYEFSGESLQRPPRGFDPEHPFIEDLKRKDFIVLCRLTEETITSGGFMTKFAGLCRDAAPLLRFLCRANGLPY